MWLLTTKSYSKLKKQPKKLLIHLNLTMRTQDTLKQQRRLPLMESHMQTSRHNRKALSIHCIRLKAIIIIMGTHTIILRLQGLERLQLKSTMMLTTLSLQLIKQSLLTTTNPRTTDGLLSKTKWSYTKTMTKLPSKRC